MPRPFLIGCFLLVLFGGFMMILFSFALLGGIGGGDQAEDPNATASSPVDTTVVDAGPISDAVPPVLKKLFSEAGGAVGVPAALLAAISQQECNRTWSLSAETLEDLIQQNKDFPLRVRTNRNDLGHMGCAYDNGSNVWGPMQFQYMTFFGYPRCVKRPRRGPCLSWEHEGQFYTDRWASSFVRRNAQYHPQRHPTPLPFTPGGQAGQLTGKSPASIFSMKDAVYAAAIKLRADAKLADKPKSADWTTSEVSRAACAYYGKCVHDGVNYNNDVTRNYQKYRKDFPAS